jgi:O-antigen/teichoic acid export membrane protein
LLKNSAVTQGIYFLNIFLRLIITPLIISSYNSEIVGFFYFILNISSYFNFFDLGISRAITYLCIEKNFKDENNYFIIAQLFYIFLGIVFSSIGASVIFFFEFSFEGLEYLELFFLVIFSIFSSTLSLQFQCIVSVYEAHGKQHIPNLIRGFTFLIIGIFQIILIKTNFSISYLILVQFLFNIPSVLYFTYKIINANNYFNYNNLKRSFFELVNRGKNIMYTNLISAVYTLMDVSALPFLGFGFSSVTIYSVSSNTSRYIHGFNSAILSPVHSFLSTEKTIIDNYLKSKNINKVVEISKYIPAIIGLNLFVMSEFIMSFWISNEFANESFYVFKILILSWTIHSYCTIGFRINEVNNDEKLNLKSSFSLMISSILGIILGFIFQNFIFFALGRLLGSIIFSIQINRYAFNLKKREVIIQFFKLLSIIICFSLISFFLSNLEYLMILIIISIISLSSIMFLFREIKILKYILQNE